MALRRRAGGKQPAEELGRTLSEKGFYKIQRRGEGGKKRSALAAQYQQIAGGKGNTGKKRMGEGRTAHSRKSEKEFTQMRFRQNRGRN